MSRGGWGKKRANDDSGWASSGGYMAAKVSKLEEQFKTDAPREKQKDGACSAIFNGVAIYVNGYTDPSVDELRRLMMLHGGQFHLYYSRSKTTHIIATNLPNSKIQELRGEKVVRPEWITDSIKAGHLLSYLQYQLYAKQKGLSFPSVCVRQAPETAAGPSLGQPLPSLHGPVSRHDQPQPGLLPSHVPLHPGNYHSLLHLYPQPYPVHNSPLAELLNPHFSPNLPSPQSNLLGQGPGLYSPFPNPVPVPSDPDPPSHPHGTGQPLPGWVRSPLPYTPPKASRQSAHPSHEHLSSGRSPLEPSLSSSHIQHSYHNLSLRLNGSLQSSHDALWPKVNGVQQEAGDDPPCPVRPPRGVKEPPPSLTNGHVHPVNGALKPLDLSPTPACPPSHKPASDRGSDRFQPPGTRPSPGRGSPGVSVSPRPSSPPPHPLTHPPTHPHSPPGQPPPPLPVNHHSRGGNPQPANEQRLKPPPPTYEEAIAASESRPRQACQSQPQNARQSVSNLNKTNPGPSPVRLNGCHHNAFPSNPAPPEGRDQSVKAPRQVGGAGGGIIAEFYSHSRLHHISTWRTEFSEYVNALQCRRRAAGEATFPGKERLKRSSAHRPDTAPSVKSCILHVDMDCFFVSVGIRHRTDLKGKPVAVTSNRGSGQVAHRAGTNPQLEQKYYQRKYTHPQPGSLDEDMETSPEPNGPVSHGNGLDLELSRAEIASCSYEARQAGVKNGMYFGQAKQLCPSLQSVPYDFQAYKEVALAMYETLASYTHDIEALSCDEALVDGSSLLAELGVTPDELASAVRADVRDRTGCCASVGMASNILLARMAIRKAKPDGQYFLRSEEVDDFIREKSVTSLPGVGRSMGVKLASLGVRTCGDLQQVSLTRLQKEFGPRTGQTLYRFCRGLDDRPVRSEKERKSVSAEMNYNIRFTQVEEAELFLTNLSMEVERRLQEAGLRGRRMTLKVMVRRPGAPVEPAKYGGHGICDNLARSVTMAQPTDSGQVIASEIIKLFHTMKLEVQEMRGVGLQVQLLEGAHSAGQDPAGSRTRSIKDMFTAQRAPAAKPNNTELHNVSTADPTSNQTMASSPRALPPCPSPTPPRLPTPAEPFPGTSKGEPPPPPRTPNHAHGRLNLSIEVPSPSQVDRSVLAALPAELREQVEESWTHRDRRAPRDQPPAPPPPSSPPLPPSSPHHAPPVGTLVLQIPNQSGSTGIFLELPDFSQVDPDVFAALPKELQEELRSAYSRRENASPQGIVVEQRNPLLQLKQSGPAGSVGRVKRRYKRKNAGSPAKKGHSPLKRPRPESSPVTALPLRSRDLPNGHKTENAPSTSSLKEAVQEPLSKFTPRPSPALAGACDFTDIRTLLREWVTSISEPMEEDILQVVKYCTDLIDDKDLEKLDLVIKYMKRLMQQSEESVWGMAFDFILDNVQVVVQQTYGSMLKIT
ncbi:DNA repair protein REV1 [Osmerus eperlanus]|uniref:DNA repair protein REV1 n=1 Tax=Osmerus eperlanus TaxID=29151 RepID=UPI002E0D56A1